LRIFLGICGSIAESNIPDEAEMTRFSIGTLAVLAILLGSSATNLKAAQSNVVYDEEIRLKDLSI